MKKVSIYINIFLSDPSLLISIMNQKLTPLSDPPTYLALKSSGVV